MTPVAKSFNICFVALHAPSSWRRLHKQRRSGAALTLTRAPARRGHFDV